MALVVGVAGGSGAGKTTLVRSVVQRLRGAVLWLPQDGFYKDRYQIPCEEKEAVNFDQPEAIDWQILVEVLQRLKSGQPAQRPLYDYATSRRLEQRETLQPAPVILLEGTLVLHEPSVRQEMDLKVYVDLDADLRLLRRIRRDTTERGLALAFVLQQYEKTVKAMHDQYVEPSKRFADLIVPGYSIARHGAAAVSALIEGMLQAQA